MRPTAVEQARVLEIACGDGANLISIALGQPGSRFLGIDLAAKGIAEGNALIAALGLKNIELRQADLLTVTPDLGTFDYIIAHGLYSWIPEAVRDRLLAVCKMLLAPQGVAYISYNTYPGCHIRQMLREMLRLHVQAIADPKDKIAQARRLARWVADAQVKNEIEKQFYLRELEKLIEHPDHLLYHDDLAELNTPSYFVQFVGHAAQHGLQFLAETDFNEMQDIFYAGKIVDGLKEMTGDQLLLREQYLDILKCRRFRRTLLCHQEVALDRDPRPELAPRFLFSSMTRPASAKPDIRSDAEEEFRGRQGGHLRTNQPLPKAVLLTLGDVWPAPRSFRELHAKVRQLLGPDDQAASTRQDTSESALADVLLNTYRTGMLQFHVSLPRYARQPGARPVASPLARWQIGQGRTKVTNLFHTSIDIVEPLGRQLIRLLDGSRDRTALVRDLGAAVTAGTIDLEENGKRVREPRRQRDLLERGLEASLAGLARLGLLMG